MSVTLITSAMYLSLFKVTYSQVPGTKMGPLWGHFSDYHKWVGFQSGVELGRIHPCSERHEQDVKTNLMQEVAILFAWKSRIYTPI